MVVMTFWPELAGIVVDVAKRELGFHSSHTHRFEEQERSRSGGVLCKGLVDADTDALSGGDFAFNQMTAEYFVDNRFWQFCTPKVIRAFTLTQIGSKDKSDFQAYVRICEETTEGIVE
jgi:hypothetical protein